jgi:hypothetical protein
VSNYNFAPNALKPHKRQKMFAQLVSDADKEWIGPHLFGAKRKVDMKYSAMSRGTGFTTDTPVFADDERRRYLLKMSKLNNTVSAARMRNECVEG